MRRLQLFLAALWWGSLTTLGCWVVPTLFVSMETPAQAGQMAAKLFFTQTWVSLGTAVLLLVAAQIEAMTLDQSRSPSLWVLTGLLLSILVEFVAVPHIMARDNLMLWHSAASVMYLLQWGCAGKALWDTQASGA